MDMKMSLVTLLLLLKRTARYVGMAPFAMSAKRVISPGVKPAIRLTLVAPIFPLPCFLMSLPENIAAITRPQGTEPDMYAKKNKNQNDGRLNGSIFINNTIKGLLYASRKNQHKRCS